MVVSLNLVSFFVPDFSLLKSSNLVPTLKEAFWQQLHFILEVFKLFEFKVCKSFIMIFRFTFLLSQ